jgi:glycine/D-amino acid oxidase-like deaminating enzyme
MEPTIKQKNWGNRPWSIDFVPAPHDLPKTVDLAVVGGGFTGLSAAAKLRQLSPESVVALFETDELGAGSSGHTGGMVLAETAVGDLPGLGDVLKGYEEILHANQVDADLVLPGVYEIGRSSPLPNSPIHWDDSGILAAMKSVPGGSINPGKVVAGLGRAAEIAGVLLFEQCNIEKAKFSDPIELVTRRGVVQAKKVLFATNAFAFELTGWLDRAESSFTLAVATETVSDEVIHEIGLAERKPFYTVDFPYLWGRLLDNTIIFGSGLLHQNDWRDLANLDIRQQEPAGLFGRLERRVRGLHPRFATISFTHRWGGPICIADGWKPIFEHHHESQNAIVLGAFSGHGVAQSVYLGNWAAEALLGRRALPNWTK